MNKVILFGGSFDPPHLGHLVVAQWVSEQFAAPVRFLPSANPPHKRPTSSSTHRLSMLRLALANNPNFILDDFEYSSATRFTVDTLRAYRRKHNLTRDQLCFVVGSDSFNSLEQWRDPWGILQECTLVVYRRELVDQSVVQRLERRNAKFVFCQAPSIEISSTMVRTRVAQGMSIKYLVPQCVAEYILKTGLYREGNI